MATAQQTILTGLQALRVTGFGQSATSAQADYCLRQLNAYLNQLLGFGGSLPVANVAANAAYQVELAWPALRVQCLSGCRTVTLPIATDLQHIPDGMRVEVVDAAANAASSNITIARNGWLIAGAGANQTISTNAGSKKLFFRADLGDWKVLADLALTDSLPFPSDFDEAIALNAARRYTIFGQSLSDDDKKRADDGARRIRARYAKPPMAQFDAAVSNIGGASGGGYTSLDRFLSGIEG